MMTSRALACLLLLLLLAPAATNGEEPTSPRPNVLLIVIDNLNDWIGCLGGHPQSPRQ